MSIIEKIAFVVSLLITLNYVFTLIPFVSWLNISNMFDSYTTNNFKSLVKRIKLLLNVQEWSEIFTVLSVPISIATLLILTYANGAEHLEIYKYLDAPSYLNIVLGLLSLMFDWYDHGTSDKGILDAKIFKHFIRKSYKSKMPKDIYKLFELYYFKYVDNKKVFSDNYHSLVLATFRFSKRIMEYTSDEFNSSAVYSYLLESDTISILAAITDVVTDDEKLKFIDSPKGSETLKEYKKSLKDIENKMLALSVKKALETSKKELEEVDLNLDLMMALNKAKENKHFIV